jgi:predicted SprT family Zn-dependent metalloprotease
MRIIRVVALGALTGVVIAVLLRSADRVNPAQPPAAPKTADQIRSDEIFKANAGQPGDPALTESYQSLNAQFFDNRLPSIPLRWEPRLDEIGPLIAEGFRMEGMTNREMILLNPAIQSDQDEFRRVLAHEMVHIAVVSEQDPHGPVFQLYLKQLAARGAFRGIVATDQEKDERRRFLERRIADLAAEAELLVRTKAAIEAGANGGQVSPDQLNVRTTEHNDRVRKHNDDVAEFNRSVEEYNQMVTYPDGLDRERLSKRGAVTGGR